MAAPKKRGRPKGRKTQRPAPKPGHDALGRPTELTPQIQAIIMAAMEEGNYLETAAGLADISSDTLRRWLRRGRREPGSIYAKFYKAYKKAEAYAEAECLATIKASDQWQATAWRLERRHPDRWGKRPPAEPKPKPQAPQQSNEDLEAELIARVEGTYRDPSDSNEEDDEQADTSDPGIDAT